MRALLGLCLVAIPCAFSASATASTMVLIDTLPGPGDPVGKYETFASDSWFDVAVGFSVPTFGTIKSVSTALYVLPSYFTGPFYVGIATDELIGNPATPSVFYSPPGSLLEYTVCSNVPRDEGGRSSCDHTEATFQLDTDTPLTIDTDIFLPKAGRYWIYTRFEADDVFAVWITNKSIHTEMIAERTGRQPEQPQDLTFFLVDRPTDALSLRVEFVPGRIVAEPGSLALLGLGLAGLGLGRRRKGN